MTGDGVNDALALKAADCSVAMAAGSDAARNVAQLVLVDNDFASMPKVVAEGRRSTCFTCSSARNMLRVSAGRNRGFPVGAWAVMRIERGGSLPADRGMRFDQSKAVA